MLCLQFVSYFEAFGSRSSSKESNTEAYLHTALMQGEPPHVERPVKFDTIIIDEAAQAFGAGF